MKEETDFEVLEPKDYAPSKDEAYSHSSLVMSSLRTVMENRSREMRDGYYNTKFDKLGNAHQVWVPDSREVFIESVESLVMIQKRDFDNIINGKLNKIRQNLNKKYKKYCEEEEKHWEDLDYEIKRSHFKQGIFFMQGHLSERILPYYRMYLRDNVNAYTKIVSLIQQLIKRDVIGDYKEDIRET